MLHQIFYYCILFFISILFIPCMGQSFFAVHVQGKIYHTTKHSYLRCGDKIDATDSLEFNTPNTWAVLVGDNGNFFLQQPVKSDSISLVHKALQPIVSSTKKVMRKDTLIVDNLQTYFEGEQFVFIGNDFQLTLNHDFYPLSDSLVLLYRYEYNERHITVKLPYAKQTIPFDPRVLYTYKGESIPYAKTTNTSIYIFNALDNMPYFAAKLNPVWLSDQQVDNELTVLKKVYTQQGQPNDVMKANYLQYITDVYGKTDELFFYHWVNTHLE